jgi:BirA family biotin operon repressor/biotin-[acetyl-CoA-carboxylase] ligase
MSALGQPFIILDTVDSTNNYAMGQVHAHLASHGAAYFAIDQTAGKGQRNSIWKSAPN